MSRVISDTQMRVSEIFRIRLNALIADCDCSIYEFAEKANISRGVITRAAIYGIILSVKPLIKMADTLNVSLEYLLGLTDNNSFEPSTSQTTFHQRLQSLCSENNLKFSQLGKHMPFNVNLFYDWQREHTLPSLDYLIAIAYYFSVSPDYLLGRSDDKNNF